MALFIQAALIRSAELSLEGFAKRTILVIASAAIVFCLLWCFTIFNIGPSWIYATEIRLQEIRSKGYAFTNFGWSVVEQIRLLLL
jgi:hypothetical protein